MKNVILLKDDKSLFHKTIVKYAKEHDLNIAFGDIDSDEFDRVLLINGDFLITDHAPNIFDVVPAHKLGVLANDKRINEGEFNIDVMVLNKEDFLDLKKETDIKKFLSDKKIHRISYKFNRLPSADKECGECRFESFFLNYNSIAGASIDVEAELRQEKRPQNIALLMDGCGIGDLVCAEPVARYAKEKLFAGENLILVTDHKELYAHLNIPMVTNKEKVQDAASYFKMNCFGRSENGEGIHDGFLSHPLMNSTDFSSILAYKVQLSPQEKQIKLPDYQELLTKEQRQILSESVLIHAGKHWKSKTFPAEWWNEVVEKISNHFPVVIVGKTIDKNQGFVPISVKAPNIEDWTDKQTLRQFIASISISPVTLTNDSCPIHIAGAFDNHILAILSCKRAEHVMPFRNGTQSYKATVLNKGYVFDFKKMRPNQLDGFKIDECSEEKILEILPSSDEVLRAVKDSYVLRRSL